MAFTRSRKGSFTALPRLPRSVLGLLNFLKTHQKTTFAYAWCINSWICMFPRCIYQHRYGFLEASSCSQPGCSRVLAADSRAAFSCPVFVCNCAGCPLYYVLVSSFSHKSIRTAQCSLFQAWLVVGITVQHKDEKWAWSDSTPT